MTKQLTLNLTAATTTEAPATKFSAFPTESKDVTWNKILQEAIKQPGLLHDCYSRFHNYSIGNLMLAAWQLGSRGIEFGQLATFEAWKRQGRFVKKGERAISLWMPISVYVREVDEETGEEVKTSKKRTFFAMKAQWFALAQTDGKDVAPESTPDWNFDQALEGLNVKLVPYDFSKVLAANCQGYAYKRNIAIAPTCEKVLSTQLHELAHVVLGHTEKTELITDTTHLPRCIKELEAESTAMLCLDVLGRDDMTVFNRGYIQHWMKTGNVTEIPEDSAKRIFAAADKILKAGQVSKKKAAKLAA